MTYSGIKNISLTVNIVIIGCIIRGSPRERKEGLTAICNSVIVIIAYTGELCQFAETQSAPACLLDKAGARGI